MSTKDSKDLLRAWQESAPYWSKHAAIVRALFEPITGALLNAAAIDRAQLVLDVAGGAGEPSVTIAKVLHGRGSVVFTDAVIKMVLSSRAEAERATISNLVFTQCLGDALPFPANTFDAVVSRLGVMLFTDPARSISEMLRVLKPGGRVALAVWHHQNVNPFFYVVANIVSRYVESQPDDPDAPGAFRFAEPGKLDRLLTDAGANAVTSSVLQFTIEAPITPDQFWELRSELSETLREKLAKLSKPELSSLSGEVKKASEQFFKRGSMRFPAEVLIVSGRKS